MLAELEHMGMVRVNYDSIKTSDYAYRGYGVSLTDFAYLL